MIVKNECTSVAEAISCSNNNWKDQNPSVVVNWNGGYYKVFSFGSPENYPCGYTEQDLSDLKAAAIGAHYPYSKKWLIEDGAKISACTVTGALLGAGSLGFFCETASNLFGDSNVQEIKEGLQTLVVNKLAEEQLRTAQKQIGEQYKAAVSQLPEKGVSLHIDLNMTAQEFKTVVEQRVNDRLPSEINQHIINDGLCGVTLGLAGGYLLYAAFKQAGEIKRSLGIEKTHQEGIARVDDMIKSMEAAPK